MSNVTTVIATIGKNSRETVHVSLTNFKGADLVDIRVFAGGAEQDAAARTPTTKGVALKLAALPALIRGLVKAEAEALSRGLLTAEQTDGVMTALANFADRPVGDRGPLRRTSHTPSGAPRNVANDTDDQDAPRLPLTGAAE